jgi:FkbM family methyltransferase
MFAAISTGLKKVAPGLHGLLKRRVQQSRLPLPKMLWGRTVWTYPRLWNRVVVDASVLHWIAEYLNPGDVFFDIGAHQGWLSLAAAWQTGSMGKVVAFEPSPASVDILSFHKRVNRLVQMDIVPKAVSKTNSSSIPFILEGDGDSVLNSLIEIEEVRIGSRGRTVIPVETITLDSYSEMTGLVPRMIKIDTEGSEIWVCEGTKRLLSENRPALIIATHPAWLPSGQKIEDLFALLSGFGYRVAACDSLQYARDDFRDYLFLAE